MAYDGSVVIEIDGDDSGFRSSVSGLKKVAAAAAKSVAAGIAGIGTALSGAAALAVKFGSEYETSLAKVSTIADQSRKSLGELSGEIMQLSADTGEGAAALNEALYSAISAGADTAHATELVGVAVKAARGGFTDTETAVDGLTSALNAYGMATTDAQGLANKFLVTQNLGKTTFGELASSIGGVAPTANAAGVSVNELLSSVAALTANGIGTSESMTGIKAALSNIIKPTSDAEKLAKKLGINFSVAALKTKGWSGFLEELKQKTGGNTDKLATLFGSVEALNTVLTLTSDQGTALMNKSLAEMQTNTTALDDAYNAMSDTTEVAAKKIKTNLQNVGISVFQQFQKPLAGALTAANKSVSDLSKSLSSGKLKKSIETIATGFGALVQKLAAVASQAIPVAINAFAGLIDNFDLVVQWAGRAVAVIAAFKTAMLVGNAIVAWNKAVTAATAALSAYTAAQAAGTAATTASTIAAGLKTAAVGVLTGQVTLATAAQYAWNTAIAANPVGLAAVAVAGLTAGAIALGVALKKSDVENIAFANSLKEITSTTEELKSSQDELSGTRAENVDAVRGQISAVQDYVTELESYLDANGKVKAGHEKRAEYLANEINNLIPDAIKKHEDEAGSYYKIKDGIDEVILAKQKEMLLDAMQEEYTNALKNQVEAQVNYTNAKALAAEKQREYNALLDEQNEKIANLDAANMSGDSGEISKAADELDLVNDRVNEVAKQFDAAKQAAADAQAAYEGFAGTIQSFNRIELAETPDELNQLAAGLSSGIEEAIDEGEEAVVRKIAELQRNYTEAVRDFVMNAGKMDPIEASQLKNAIDTTAVYIDDAVIQAQKAGIDVGEAAAAGVLTGNQAFSESVMEVIMDSLEQLDGADVEAGEYGQYFAESIANGIAENGVSVEDAVNALNSLGLVTLAQSVQEAAKVGQDSISSMADGMEQTAPEAEAAAGVAADGSLDRVRDTASDMTQTGIYLMQGLALGITGSAAGPITAAQMVANQIKRTVRSAMDINSPSRVMIWMGQMIGQGLANGMQSKMTLVRNVARRLGDVITSEIEAVQARIEAIEKQARERQEAEELAEHKEAIEKKYAELEKAELSKREKIRQEIADLEDDWNKKQIEKAEEAEKAALNARLDALEDFKDDYEDALEEIADKQESFAEKLIDFGGLFERTTKGEREIFKLTDLDKQRDQIIAYGEALESLKDKSAPAGFLFEVVEGMSIEDGMDYISKLSKMKDDELTAYFESWTAVQQAGHDVAAKFYQDQLDVINTEFAEKFAEEMTGMPAEGGKVGTEIVNGIIAGMESGKDPLAEAARTIVRIALDAMRDEADINSPSKEAADQVGRWIPAGVAFGFDKAMPDLLASSRAGMDQVLTQMRATVDAETTRVSGRLSTASTPRQAISDQQLATLAKMIGVTITPAQAEGPREIVVKLGDDTELARALVPAIRLVEDQSPRIVSDI